MSDDHPAWKAPRRRPGAWLASTWKLVGWPLVGVLTIAAIVLGFVGFREYFDRMDQQKSITDLFYRSLQLFVLESGSVPPTDAPWTLEVARLLAPAITAVALVAAAVVVFRQELDEVRLRRRKRHIVVCGLGTRGSRLVKALAGEGYPLVVIERDAGVAGSDELRRLRVPVIVGDARDPDVLRRAGVARASYIVALTGSDDTNAEVAVRSAALTESRGDAAATCLAHVSDPELCVLLRSEELARGRRGGLRLELFNVYQQGAQALLKDHPPFLDGGSRPPHIVVVGLTHLGQSVIAEAARAWRFCPSADRRKAIISLVDPNAKRGLELLEQRYVLLPHVAQLHPIVADIAPFPCDRIAPTPTAIYVCVDDDLTSVQVALEAISCPNTGSAPVVAQLNRGTGLAELVDRPGVRGRLYTFDLLDRTLRSDLLFGGTFEILARAIHDEYRVGQLALGVGVEQNPSVVPWEELPATMKESNRDQASHIGTKLAAIGWAIAPLTDWSSDEIEFDPEDVELLARMEHDRWVRQRVREGWRPGPKDVHTKTTPYLVPWEDLSEEVRELDRRTVRHIPALVVRAGYQVAPIPGATHHRP